MSVEARTTVRMAERIASDRSGHALTTSTKSGYSCMKSAEQNAKTCWHEFVSVLFGFGLCFLCEGFKIPSWQQGEGSIPSFGSPLSGKKPLKSHSQNIEFISQKILGSEYFIALTGAGISTESGIPDYRSKGGIWEKFQPVYIDEFMRSRAARIKYWRRKAELYPDLIKAQPNAAHRGLAELYKLGLLKSIITQNIDGLHQKAGMPDQAIIELHGNNFRVRCMTCDRISSIHEAQKRIESGDCAPECECGGYLKPDTISFGQSLRADILAQAYEQSGRCSMMLVIGSTLKVQPAAGLPGIAKQNGAFLAMINLSETPCDGIFDLIIREKAGLVVQAIVDKIKERRP